MSLYADGMGARGGRGLSLWQQRRVPQNGGVRAMRRVSGTYSRRTEQIEQPFTRRVRREEPVPATTAPPTTTGTPTTPPPTTPPPTTPPPTTPPPTTSPPTSPPTTTTTPPP
jgi:hypothetical protein